MTPRTKHCLSLSALSYRLPQFHGPKLRVPIDHRIGSPHLQHAGGMKANSRSVNAIRKADCGNHRTTFPHATRPGMGREKGDDERSFACPYRLYRRLAGVAQKIGTSL